MSDPYLIRLPKIGGRVATAHLRKTMFATLEGLADSQRPFRVDGGDPFRLRLAVETLARYFRREEGYDFVQYSAREDATDDGCAAFLWTVCSTEEAEVAFGACCFRLRERDGAPPGWALQWIWLHPYFRGHGHLLSALPMFRREFGDFDVEPPYSRAMSGFLREHAPWTRVPR